MTDYNYSICRLLKVQISDFYDHIYIPYTHFKFDNWGIDNVINSNTDALFYNETYMTEDDKVEFEEVFKKYAKMISDIMDPSNKFYEYLYKWTEFDSNVWKKKKNNLSTVYLMITKFKYVSPLFILGEYFSYLKKHKGADRETVHNYLHKYLTKHMKGINIHVKNFKKAYTETINKFVYLHPLQYEYNSNYAKGFVNTLILETLDLTNILIDQNIYAIHSIITEIIDEYTPLDILNAYEPAKHNGRNVYIV